MFYFLARRWENEEPGEGRGREYSTISWIQIKVAAGARSLFSTKKHWMDHENKGKPHTWRLGWQWWKASSGPGGSSIGGVLPKYDLKCAFLYVQARATSWVRFSKATEANASETGGRGTAFIAKLTKWFAKFSNIYYCQLLSENSQPSALVASSFYWLHSTSVPSKIICKLDLEVFGPRLSWPRHTQDPLINKEWASLWGGQHTRILYLPLFSPK